MLLWSFPPLGDVLIYKLPNVIILTKDKNQLMGADQVQVQTKPRFFKINYPESMVVHSCRGGDQWEWLWLAPCQVYCYIKSAPS